MTNNVDVIKTFFDVNWPTSIIAKPTFAEVVHMRQHVADTGDKLIKYLQEDHQEIPIDFADKWYNFKDVFKFRLLSETRQDCKDMLEALKHVRNAEFYKGPWFPKSHKSEVLFFLDMNEGSGTDVDDEQGTYNFDFDATDPPSWVTTSALHQKNYILYCGDADNHDDFIASAITFPNGHAAITFEIVVKLVSGFYAAQASDFNLFGNYWADDLYKLIILNSGNKLKYHSEDDATTETLTAGYIPENKWTSVMVTHGPRGMEIYVDGILRGQDTSNTTMPSNDSDTFKIGETTSHAGCDIQTCNFRCANKQRLPYDKLRVLGGKPVADKKTNLFKLDVTIEAQLFNVFLGGNP